MIQRIVKFRVDVGAPPIEGEEPIPTLIALGAQLRLWAVIIDVAAASGWPLWDIDPEIKTVFEHPQVKTAQRIEGGKGRTESPAQKTLRGWGVTDQHGVYLLAGLTKAESEVAFLAFDRGYVQFGANGTTELDAKGIGKQLGRPATTIRVQFFRAKERLQKLSA